MLIKAKHVVCIALFVDSEITQTQGLYHVISWFWDRMTLKGH